MISDNGIDSISMAIRLLEKIETLNNRYENVSRGLKSIYYELQELSRDIVCYKQEICFDEQEREFVEERIDLINSLKRKYGNTIEEILNYKNEIEDEIKKINNLDEYTTKLKTQKIQIEEKLNNIANEMHNIRVNFANKLKTSINKELEKLEMKNAKINIHVEYLENDFLKDGKDIVKFYIATNIGEDEKELSKIASGGEMSRIMLAIKKVLADSDMVPILIFDEIDTGISGKAANAVADMLRAISLKHQILCISHLPNIAAAADYNYYISKIIKEDRTLTQIKLLEENEVINEIARISSGDINEVSIKYAEKLRNKKAS